jgi:hypothetical protein
MVRKIVRKMREDPPSRAEPTRRRPTWHSGVSEQDHREDVVQDRPRALVVFVVVTGGGALAAALRSVDVLGQRAVATG